MIPIPKDVLWATNNQARTHSIFLETAKPGEIPALTIEAEHPTLPCLKSLYLSFAVRDPTEVTFAEVVFNDLKYWIRLREAKFFKQYVEEWRVLAEEKRKQIAFEAIIKEVEEGGRSSFTAAKYLIEEPWKPKTKETQKKKRETSQKAFSVFDEDIDRLKDAGLLQ